MPPVLPPTSGIIDAAGRPRMREAPELKVQRGVMIKLKRPIIGKGVRVLAQRSRCVSFPHTLNGIHWTESQISFSSTSYRCVLPSSTRNIISHKHITQSSVCASSYTVTWRFLMMWPYYITAHSLLGLPWQSSTLSRGISWNNGPMGGSQWGEGPSEPCPSVHTQLGTVWLLNWRKIALYLGLSGRPLPCPLHVHVWPQ